MNQKCYSDIFVLQKRQVWLTVSDFDIWCSLLPLIKPFYNVYIKFTKVLILFN